MPGTMSAEQVVYCPHCEGQISQPIPGLDRVVGNCPRCQGQPMLWPADLPLPTRANVRALWGCVRSQGRSALPGNPRGRWNG